MQLLLPTFAGRLDALYFLADGEGQLPSPKPPGGASSFVLSTHAITCDLDDRELHEGFWWVAYSTKFFFTNQNSYILKLRM